MGPDKVPTAIKTPWTHFSVKEIRVLGGPKNKSREEGEMLLNLPDTHVVCANPLAV